MQGTQQADFNALFTSHKSELSDRRRRHLMVAMCRHASARTLLIHPDLKNAITVSEKYADGLATRRQLRRADSTADAFCFRNRLGSDPLMWACCWIAHSDLDEEGSRGCVTCSVAHYARDMGQSEDFQKQLLVDAVSPSPFAVRYADEKHLVSCKRCYGSGQRLRNGGRMCGTCSGQGNIAVLHRWYSIPHQDKTVMAVASAIYADGKFTDLPILADALEDAGRNSCCSTCRRHRTSHCTFCHGSGTDPLLTHLRSPGPHTRACWALGFILGYE